MDAILNNSKRSMMPAGHHSDSDSTLLPLPKSSITWLGGIFARLPPLAARLFMAWVMWTMWFHCCCSVGCSAVNVETTAAQRSVSAAATVSSVGTIR